jgi:penicillin-binding protein 1A
VPENLVKALIATEDTRFYVHPGIDARGVARAMYRNIRARKVLEGGSTLTQQLAKVLFLTPEKSYVRKLKEMALALRIEQRYTKREILLLYLNQIYFGSGAYGVEAAARVYFDKPARELNVAECALLAGLPRSPKYYSPFKAPESSRQRRAHVLNRMVAAGVITILQADEAKKTPLPVPATVRAGGPAPYFVEYIRQKVEERFGSSILYSGGLNVHTTVNDELQAAAQPRRPRSRPRSSPSSRRPAAFGPWSAGAISTRASLTAQPRPFGSPARLLNRSSMPRQSNTAPALPTFLTIHP